VYCPRKIAVFPEEAIDAKADTSRHGQQAATRRSSTSKRENPRNATLDDVEIAARVVEAIESGFFHEERQIQNGFSQEHSARTARF